MEVFFRRGKAVDAVEDRYGGWADLDLSPAGIGGAKEAGLKLKERGIHPDLILMSSLKKAVQTARGIAGVLDVPVESFIYL